MCSFYVLLQAANYREYHNCECVFHVYVTLLFPFMSALATTYETTAMYLLSMEGRWTFEDGWVEK